MSKLTKSKREKLILLTLATVLLLAAGWKCGVSPQRARLRSALLQAEKANEQVKIAQRQGSLAKELEREWESATQSVYVAESRMAAGDVYRWLGKLFREFESSEKVEVITLEPPRVEESSILPVLPYKSAIFMVSGKAYYDDLVRFVARLENDFPHFRVRQLDLEPAVFGDGTAAEEEKLAFKLELLTLVKAGGAAR